MKSIHAALELIISHEKTIEVKLDLLTEIAITTTSKEVLRATEEIRAHLSVCQETKEKQGNKNSRVPDTVESFGEGDSEWEDYCNDPLRKEEA